MVTHRVAQLAALVIFASGCGKVTFGIDDRPCRGGKCASGYECRPDTQICVEAIVRNCDGTGACWSDVQADDKCSVEGSYLPCGADANCDAGCRTCEKGHWTRCGFVGCEPGTVSDCSTCGHDCTQEVLNADATCVGSGFGAACDYGQCVSPAVDADGDRTNGCECISAGAETCDGADNNCDGAIDNMTSTEIGTDCEAQFPATHVRVWACSGGCMVSFCEAGWYDVDGLGDNGCEEDCLPTNGGLETCDGVNNDCNDTVDDVIDLGADCSVQEPFAADVATWACGGVTGCEVATCMSGLIDLNGLAFDGCEIACVVTGAEICDGVDNDCSGVPDDISQTALDTECATAYPSAVQVATWGCVSAACAVVTCNADNYNIDTLTSTGCNYPCTATGAETCDGNDNDCNGTADDIAQAALDTECAAIYSTAADVTAWQCPTDTCLVLTCAGTASDIDGLPGNGCEDNCVSTGPEVCDGLDNDCSGTPDDMSQAALDAECATVYPIAVEVAAWNCAGAACAIANCTADNWNIDMVVSTGCEYSCAQTGAEICDGTDNDCDSFIDTADTELSSQALVDTDCSAQNASAVEVAAWQCTGACATLTCTTDNYDDDGVPTNGCEYPCVAAGAETCNDSDDDCDGIIDNSTVVSNCGCADGTLPAGAEICWNGIDDDCNEAIDEGCGCQGTDTMTIAHESLRCDSGTTGLTLMHLAVTTDCNNDLVELIFDEVTGSTTVDADVVNVNLYDDIDNSGDFTGGDLLLAGPVAMSGGSITFTGFVFPVTTAGPGHLIVVADGVGPAYFAAQVTALASFTLSDTNQAKALATIPLEGGLHSLAGRVCTGAGGTPADTGFGSQAGTTVQKITGPSAGTWALGAGDESGWAAGTAHTMPEIADCDLETWGDLSLHTLDGGQASEFLHIDTGVPLGFQLCTGLSMRAYASIWRSNQGGRCDFQLLQNLNSVVLLPYTGATTVAAAAMESTAGSTAITGPTTSNCTVSPASDYIDFDLTNLYGAGLNTGTLEVRFIPEGSGNLDTADGQEINSIPEIYLRVLP